MIVTAFFLIINFYPFKNITDDLKKISKNLLLSPISLIALLLAFCVLHFISCIFSHICISILH